MLIVVHLWWERDQIWWKCCHFGKILQLFGIILRVYLVFGKILNLLWQILCAFEQMFIIISGQILKNNLDILSHWSLVVANARS